MDVQAAAPIATIVPLPQTVQPAPAVTNAPPSAGGSAPAASPVVTPASDAGSGSSGNTSNSAIGPTPGLATLPAGPPDGSKKNQDTDPGLVSGIATLYNTPEQNITVSFQIEQQPNEIVTVFTDKRTGKVIVQFPSETMIALAKLFDKLDGSVVNKQV